MLFRIVLLWLTLFILLVYGFNVSADEYVVIIPWPKNYEVTNNVKLSHNNREMFLSCDEASFLESTPFNKGVENGCTLEIKKLPAFVKAYDTVGSVYHIVFIHENDIVLRETGGAAQVVLPDFNLSSQLNLIGVGVIYQKVELVSCASYFNDQPARTAILRGMVTTYPMPEGLCCAKPEGELQDKWHENIVPTLDGLGLREYAEFEPKKPEVSKTPVNADLSPETGQTLPPFQPRDKSDLDTPEVPSDDFGVREDPVDEDLHGREDPEGKVSGQDSTEPLTAGADGQLDNLVVTGNGEFKPKGKRSKAERKKRKKAWKVAEKLKEAAEGNHNHSADGEPVVMVPVTSPPEKVNQVFTDPSDALLQPAPEKEGEFTTQFSRRGKNALRGEQRKKKSRLASEPVKEHTQVLLSGDTLAAPSAPGHSKKDTELSRGQNKVMGAELKKEKDKAPHLSANQVDDGWVYPKSRRSKKTARPGGGSELSNSPLAASAHRTDPASITGNGRGGRGHNIRVPVRPRTEPRKADLEVVDADRFELLRQAQRK